MRYPQAALPFLFVACITLALPNLYLYFCTYENMIKNETGRDRPKLTWSQRPFNSMGHPALPPKELEQLPGPYKPASYARPSRWGGV